MVDLDDFARDIAKASGLDFVEIIRPKIYKYQLIELDGSRLFITGKDEVRNGVEIALSVEEAKTFKCLSEKKAVADGEVEALYNSMITSIEKYSKRLAENIKVETWKDKFLMLNLDSKYDVLESLAFLAAAKKNKVDLTQVGRAKTAGQLKINYSNMLNKDKGITFVDQSITGMFERRTHVGL